MADIGRPTSYSQLIADRIISEIRNTSKGLTTICAPDDMPCRSTVYNWMDENPEFLNRYARAKQDQADMLAEEIIDISDDTSNDTIDGDFGPMENKEWVNRSKLRIDARKWVAAKLAPKKYGDKLDVTTAGEAIPGGAIAIDVIMPKDDD